MTPHRPTWLPPAQEARHHPLGPDAPLVMPAGRLLSLRAAAEDDLRALFARRATSFPVEWVRELRDVAARLGEMWA